MDHTSTCDDDWFMPEFQDPVPSCDFPKNVQILDLEGVLVKLLGGTGALEVGRLACTNPHLAKTSAGGNTNSLTVRVEYIIIHNKNIKSH